MSNYVTCAICGVVGDSANFDLMFQEGSTYPDYWQCKDDCSPDDDPELSVGEQEDAEDAWLRQQMGGGW